MPFRGGTTINAENEDQLKKEARALSSQEFVENRHLAAFGYFLCRRFCRDRYLIIFFDLIRFLVVGNSFLFLDRRLMVSCFFSVMNFRRRLRGSSDAYPVSFRIRGRSWR